MTWRDDHQRAAHRDRSQSISRANTGDELGRRVAERARSRGGAPIWNAREAFQPVTIRFRGSACTTCASNSHLSSEHDASADPDGFAVYGRYPKGFLDHVVRSQWLGDVRRDAILHVGSGTLSVSEAWTVDIRPQAKPRVVADGAALPFPDGSFLAVMLDPPYSEHFARVLYGTENPRPSWLLCEAARVVVPNGRIGILHVAVPFSPPGCRLITVHGVTTGVGFRIRAFSIYEKHQASLL